ncbi:hypothetical protein CXG81DRAFT_24849 [Caulochytrium protostelioides]|uniref:Uncharacterized protein n=1 Tax=Caulochytrium protostelioides TaxID=1555241 RepID=A0A4P9XAU9_9FUNG|nr:hypothetical protein CXG81DRAFT_24849 [Caulochytrium protostelioides]|eukprot:RKP02476.1 hypothetical protein CXG81DRAFT_24849 [Caulochytrium protostelioides]
MPAPRSIASRLGDLPKPPLISAHAAAEASDAAASPGRGSGRRAGNGRRGASASPSLGLATAGAGRRGSPYARSMAASQPPRSGRSSSSSGRRDTPVRVTLHHLDASVSSVALSQTLLALAPSVSQLQLHAAGPRGAHATCVVETRDEAQTLVDTFAAVAPALARGVRAAPGEPLTVALAPVRASAAAAASGSPTAAEAAAHGVKAHVIHRLGPGSSVLSSAGAGAKPEAVRAFASRLGPSPSLATRLGPAPEGSAEATAQREAPAAEALAATPVRNLNRATLRGIQGDLKVVLQNRRTTVDYQDIDIPSGGDSLLN